MLFRLAFKSFKKQVRSYLIYFLSMVLAVAIFYCFSALTYDQTIIVRASQDLRIEQILNFGGTVVIAILLFFMLSANRFFLSRRSEEIGIYQMFGLKKRKIVLMFALETLLLGLCSLVAGIFLGVIFSKLFSMILVKAMALNVASDFFISWRSIGVTTIIIFFVLTVVALRTSWLVLNSRLSELFQEKELDSHLLRIRLHEKFLGIAGIILLMAGYFSAFKTRNLVSFLTPHTGGLGAYFFSMLIPFVFCVLGTYLFFGWSMKVIIWLSGRHKSYSNRDLNALMLGDTNFNLIRNWRTSAAVTIIASISMLLISLAVSLFAYSLEEVLHTDPVSFQVAEEDHDKFLKILNENGGQVKESQTLDFKTTGSYLSYKVANQQIGPVVELVNLLSFSNYQAYRKINRQLPKIRLAGKNEAVLINRVQNAFQEVVTYDSNIKLPGVSLSVIDTQPDYLGSDLLRYSGITLVVHDEVFLKAEGVVYSIEAINTKVENQDAFASAMSSQLATKWIDPVVSDFQWKDDYLTGHITRLDHSGDSQDAGQVRLNLSSQYPNWRSARRQTGLVIYVSVFIGLISLITTASILSLRQLSEATMEKKNYQLLHILGVSKKKIQHLIYKENALVFLPVMLIAVANSFFGMYYLSQYISTPSFWLPNVFLGILLLIYAIFYLLTILFYRRTVKV